MLLSVVGQLCVLTPRSDTEADDGRGSEQVDHDDPHNPTHRPLVIAERKVSISATGE